MIYYSMSIGAALHCLSVSGELGSLDGQRLTRAFNAMEDPRGVGAFLATLATANVKCKTDMSSAERGKFMELGKRWWGGGREAVTLRPRIKST